MEIKFNKKEVKQVSDNILNEFKKAYKTIYGEYDLLPRQEFKIDFIFYMMTSLLIGSLNVIDEKFKKLEDSIKTLELNMINTHLNKKDN